MIADRNIIRPGLLQIRKIQQQSERLSDAGKDIDGAMIPVYGSESDLITFCVARAPSPAAFEDKGPSFGRCGRGRV
jgi:hypothetical protein